MRLRQKTTSEIFPKSYEVHLTLILRISVQIARHDAIYKLKKFVKKSLEIFSLETLRVDATRLLRYIFLENHYA